jgi:uncharacterized protein with von Willebrand factor type A (vWA) domain
VPDLRDPVPEPPPDSAVSDFDEPDADAADSDIPDADAVDSDVPDFDAPAFAGRLCQALRNAGIPAAPDRAARFLEALALIPPTHRRALYWTARLSFVGAREHVDAFDRVFAAVFGTSPDRAAGPDARSAAAEPTPHTEPGAPPPSGLPVRQPWGAESPLHTGGARPDDAGGRRTRPARDESAALRLLSSRGEAFAHKDFAAFTRDELTELERLLDTLAVGVPLRRGRRREPHPAGRRTDLRRSLRRSMRTGGEPFRLARSRNRPRRRPLVLLCDISGSMEPYTRAYLRFFSRVCARSTAGLPAEAFVFATRLTRLTAALRHSDPDTALSRAGATAADWSGGTLIGAALAEFNRRHGRRGMARGAVVVVFSDGWEAGDPALVGREAERLSRLARRLIWVNPRKAAPGYAPLAGGMAAALPHCDAFVSGHSLAALAELVDAIAAA